MSLTFVDEPALQAWLDSPDWSRLLEVGAGHAIRREFSDLVIVDDEPPPTGVGIFVHRVEPANSAGSRRSATAIDGSERGRVGLPILDPHRSASLVDGVEEWTAVVKFRTDALLAGWRESPERAVALGELRSKLEQDF